MTFGATCSPTSAQFVKNTNADDFSSEFPKAAKAIKESHYVDDYVASFATEEEAAQVTKEVVEVHRRGGFTLRKIISNSQAVISALDGHGGGEGSADMQLDATATNKILGMRWRTDNDALYFTINFPNLNKEIVAGTRTPTKRELLSAIMSIFDPFGFLCELCCPPRLYYNSYGESVLAGMTQFRMLSTENGKPGVEKFQRPQDSTSQGAIRRT